MSQPFEAEPGFRVTAPDGASIAVFRVLPRSGLDRAIATRARPLLLVHGSTADHTTWRVAGPMLARRRPVLAMDRRGRGASGDGPAYAIEREFEDVAAVAEALAADGGGSPVDIVGHSYGGRCALGASLRTDAIRRVVAYEGAPTPPDLQWAEDAAMAGIIDQMRRGEHDAALEAFLRAVVGMDDAAIARYRAEPVWPLRVAAMPTLAREIESERSPAAGLEALGLVNVPVLQILGTASPPTFRPATEALAGRLRAGRVIEIEGAAHAAHHTHSREFVTAVEAFLDG